MSLTLKDNLKEHYEAHSLSSRQLNQLEKLNFKNDFYGEKKRPKKAVYWSIPALVAGVVFIFLVSPERKTLSPQQLVHEMVYNHNKTLNLEFSGRTIEEIKPYFGKLDFKLVPSQRQFIIGKRLIGGRYISINNKLAAELKLKGDNNNNYTWYQTSIPADGTLVNNRFETYDNGVKVIIWAEKGVLHGIAGGQSLRPHGLSGKNVSFIPEY